MSPKEEKATGCTYYERLHAEMVFELELEKWVEFC